MTLKKLPPITTGKDEYSERLASVIASAFAGDALNRAALLSSDKLPNGVEISAERRTQHFLPSIKKKAASGAILAEAGDWAAAALW